MWDFLELTQRPALGACAKVVCECLLETRRAQSDALARNYPRDSTEAENITMQLAEMAPPSSCHTELGHAAADDGSTERLATP